MARAGSGSRFCGRPKQVHLTWAICHDDGREKGWLDSREGGQVTGALNGQRTASVTVPLVDVAHLVHPSRSRLKVHCHPVEEDPGRFLLFNGLIQQPRALGDTVEIAAVDVSGRLLNANPAPMPKVADAVLAMWDPLTGTDAAIMWELINRSEARTRALQAIAVAAGTPLRYPPLMGIIEGTLADSGAERSASILDGSTTWDLLLKRSAGRNSPDFELEPLDRDDDVYARFNTFYPQQGTDKRDDVILEYGENLSDFAYEPSGVDICNHYCLVGTSPITGRPLAYVAESVSSIIRHGLHSTIAQASDVGDYGTLEERAKGYVAHHAWPINFIDATPVAQIGGLARGFVRAANGNLVESPDREWTVPPAFGPPGTGLGFDYWLGDEITVRAKDQLNLYVDKVQPGPATDLYGRVTDFTFTEADGDGNVVVTHSITPRVPAADVTGYITAVNTDDGT